jgi:hypothetical protein
MIPIEYELGRQLQLERQFEAATFRLACRGAVARDIRPAHHLSLPTPRQLLAWIDRLPGGSPLDEACSTGTRHAYPAVRPVRSVDATRLLRVFR